MPQASFLPSPKGNYQLIYSLLLAGNIGHKNAPILLIFQGNQETKHFYGSKKDSSCAISAQHAFPYPSRTNGAVPMAQLKFILKSSALHSPVYRYLVLFCVFKRTFKHFIKDI